MLRWSRGERYLLHGVTRACETGMRVLLMMRHESRDGTTSMCV